MRKSNNKKSSKQEMKQRFAEWLDEDETVYYSEFYEQKKLFSSFYIFIATLFFIICLVLFLAESPYIFPVLIFVGIITLDYLKTVSYKKKERLKTTYAITYKRIILLDKYHSSISIPYHKIYNLIPQENRLHIITTPFAKSSPIIIEAAILPESLKQQILKKWEKRSPYTLFKNRIKLFSQKYDLSYIPFIYGQRKAFVLSGRINNYVFYFKMESMHDFKSITAKLTCSNEENNYLLIQPEKTADRVSKLMGMQDYKIGMDWFDKNFILQGNNENFIHDIITEEIALSIDKSMTQLKGKITIGAEKEMKKEKIAIIDNDDLTLDAHLIQEDKNEFTRIENHTSELIYTSEELRYNDNFEELADDIVENLVVMILIAGRVNAYDGK